MGWSGASGRAPCRTPPRGPGPSSLIRHVPIEQDNPIGHLRVVEPLRRRSARAAVQPVDLVFVLEQQLREIRTVLTGDPGDKRVPHDRPDFTLPGSWARDSFSGLQIVARFMSP